MSDHNELVRAGRSLKRSAEKALPMIRAALSVATWIKGVSAGTIAALSMLILDLRFEGIAAAIATGVSAGTLAIALLAVRAVRLRDEDSVARVRRLLDLQETYWTLDRALVIDTDITRHTGLRVRVWLQNRGPDEIRAYACSALLVLEAPFVKELRARSAAPLHETVVAPGVRMCCFEFNLADIDQRRRFQLEKSTN